MLRCALCPKMWSVSAYVQYALVPNMNLFVRDLYMLVYIIDSNPFHAVAYIENCNICTAQ